MIRLSQERDLKTIVQISQQSQHNRWSEEEYLRVYHYPSYAIYVYENKTVLAYAIFYFPYGNEEIELLDLAVDAQFRNQKIASQFLKTVLDDFQVKKHQEVFLEVSCENKPAIHLYNRLGFEIIGVRKNYYGKNKDAYLMRKRL